MLQVQPGDKPVTIWLPSIAFNIRRLGKSLTRYDRCFLAAIGVRDAR